MTVIIRRRPHQIIITPPNIFMQAKMGGDAVNTLLDKYEADVIIGPTCSVTAIAAAFSTPFYNTPMISYSAASPDLSNPTLYPGFARTTSSAESLAHAIVATCRHYDWNEIAVLYHQDSYSMSAATSYLDIFKGAGLTVLFFEIFESATVEYMTALKETGAKIVATVSYCDGWHDIMLQALDLNMLDG